MASHFINGQAGLLHNYVGMKYYEYPTQPITVYNYKIAICENTPENMVL
jgi:hypothetical protein